MNAKGTGMELGWMLVVGLTGVIVGYALGKFRPHRRTHGKALRDATQNAVDEIHSMKESVNHAARK